VGERGVLVLDRLGTARVRFDTARPGGRAGASLAEVTRGATDAILRAARVWRGRPEPSFAIAFRSFVAAVRGETQEFPDLQDGLEALRVVDAAERSAMTALRAAVAVRMDDAQASRSSSSP
jgi:predicted dehydrogenase